MRPREYRWNVPGWRDDPRVLVALVIGGELEFVDVLSSVESAHAYACGVERAAGFSNFEAVVFIEGDPDMALYEEREAGNLELVAEVEAAIAAKRAEISGDSR